MDEHSIFHRAVAIGDAQRRAAFLDAACGAEGELRAELESLLRHHELAGDFLEHVPRELQATCNGAVDDTRDGLDDDVILGRLEPTDQPDCLGRLGEFTIRKVLGRGGMGVVLLADDPKLDRAVSIKVMDSAFNSCPTATQRFFREARAAAAIRHPNVVAIHAIQDQLPLRYLVLEYVEGRSLQEEMDSGQALSIEQVVRIGIQAADAIAAAHRIGLIHRDIKPGNFLLEDATGRVKLTDFGLARAIDDLNVTQAGLIAGTPNYMSPEQALGNRIDHRSDLFSLGSVLFALCAGKPAFSAGSSVATLRRICDDQPPRLRELNPDVPPWLERLIERLLRKDPARRVASAEEVADLLRRRSAGARRGATKRTAEPARSHPARRPRLSLSSVSVAVLLAGLVVSGLLTAGAWRATRSTQAKGGRWNFGVLAGFERIAKRVANHPLHERENFARVDGTLSQAPGRAEPLATVGLGGGQQAIKQAAVRGQARRTPPELPAWSAITETSVDDVNWGLHVSADGKTLYYASLRPGGVGQEDLWLRRRGSVDEAWSEPESLGPIVNSPAVDSAPTLSADGLLLVFESQRKGGYGVSDLWMATREAVDQPWNQPVNLGPRINNRAWQRAPAISGDGRTLIYSTTFPYRQGNVLQIATRDSVTGEWSEPRTLELPGAAEFSYQTPSLSADERTLLFSRGEDAHWQIAYCTRPSRTAAWSEVRLLRSSSNAPVAGLFPSLAADGQTVLFVSGSQLVRLRRFVPWAADETSVDGVVSR